MSDNNSLSSFWAGVVVTVGLGAAVYSCSKEPTPNAPLPVALPAISSGPSPMPSASASPPPPKPVPRHRYSAVEGSIYYYEAGVSEEERKKGKLAPDMLGYRYLGRSSDGLDTVELIRSGAAVSTSQCARPCRAIHRDNGEVTGFDEGSIIGSVFADVADGKLKKWIPPKPVVQEGPWEEFRADEVGADDLP